MTPSKPLRPSVCVLLAAATFAACSNGGGANAPFATTPTILRTEPADGAADVEPTAEVRIEVALPIGGSPNGDVTVGDGVNQLPGTFVLVGGGTWRWVPQNQLPRGSTVEIASRTQGPVARFAVREAATLRSYDLAGVTVERVMVWPNGRSAVCADQRWFEVTATGTVERSTNLRPDALPFGDGRAVQVEYDPVATEQWLVRTGLDGERDRVLMPATSGPIDLNTRGDVVTFTRENTVLPGQGGFWVLGADGLAFDRIPYVTIYGPTPRIADDGAVSGAWGEPGKLRFVRFAAGSQVPLEFEEAGLTPQPRWDVAADGSGWLLWTVRDDPRWILRGRRFEPETGLGDAVDLVVWEPGPGFTFLGIEAVRTGVAGSTVVELNVSGIGNAYRQFVRLERDGWVSIPNAFSATTFERKLLQSPVRAETWGLLRSADGRELAFQRSRPRAQSELDRLLYRIPEPMQTIGEFHGGLDDAGRAIVAFAIGGLGVNQQVTRVVVLE
ncbi:MAG: hypothetical protein ACE37K_14920 [Planctomycetota bacterium]